RPRAAPEGIEPRVGRREVRLDHPDLARGGEARQSDVIGRDAAHDQDVDLLLVQETSVLPCEADEVVERFPVRRAPARREQKDLYVVGDAQLVPNPGSMRLDAVE